MSEISQILTTIDAAVTRLSTAAARKQPAVFKQLLAMLKKLETKGDALINNINNLKLINAIKIQIEKLTVDEAYKAEVKSFLQSYQQVQALHNTYFARFAGFNKRNKKALAVLSNTAVETTLINLTEAGLQAGVTEGLRKILITNVGNGGSYADLTEQLRNYMLADAKNEGALHRYVKTYSNTAINQFSAEYGNSLAADLRLYWYMYDGSLLETSREFCIQCVEKKYIHVSEFPLLLEGKINGEQLHINSSTKLPEGMMAGTDISNLVRRRGGWNCGHQMIAVDEMAVPQNKKTAVYSTTTYKEWSKANGTKPDTKQKDVDESKFKVEPKTVRLSKKDTDSLVTAGFNIRSRGGAELHEFVNNVFPNFDIPKLLLAADKALSVTTTGSITKSIYFDPTSKELSFSYANGMAGLRFDRQFSNKNGVKSVYHDYFTIPDNFQGQGIAKEVFRSSIQEYVNMDLDRIDVFAALSGGGYTWARHGFVATQPGEVQRILFKAAAKLPDEKYRIVEKIYKAYYDKKPDGEDFPIKTWADLPFMKDVLRGTAWHGSVNMKNKEQFNNFVAYVFGKK